MEFIKNVTEESYESLLCNDYDQLIFLLKNKKRIICFIDEKKEFGIFRKMTIAISMKEFSSLYLGFNEEGFEEPYKQYCKIINLKFIKP